MNELQIFKSEQFGEIRTVKIENEPYFVGKDVAEILGYKDTADALRNHCDEEDKRLVKVGEIPTLKTSNYGAYIINESGLYSLIMGSKLPEAKRFKRWITHEVIPTIRKTGGYVNNEDTFINTYLPFADDGVKALFSPDVRCFAKSKREDRSGRKHTYNAHYQSQRKRTAVLYKQIFS